MKLTIRKERIKFNVASDLAARHTIYAAFLGYKERKRCKMMQQKKIDAHQTKIEEHQTRIDAHQTRIDAHQTRIDAHQTRIDTHQTRIDELQKQVSDLQQSLDLLIQAQICRNDDFVQSGPTALVRTKAFIECRHCRFKNTKYQDNCIKCDTILSTKPYINKFL